jgi:hypothetical protein
MLAEQPIDVMLLGTDLGVAKEFYGEKLGLQILLESDEPWLKTVDGVADVGPALAAWLVDPHGNSLGLLQFKGAEAS